MNQLKDAAIFIGKAALITLIGLAILNRAAAFIPALKKVTGAA
jgi:hypothetical protein